MPPVNPNADINHSSDKNEYKNLTTHDSPLTTVLFCFFSKFVQFYPECQLMIAAGSVILCIGIIKGKLFYIDTETCRNTGESFLLSYPQFLTSHVVISDAQTHRLSCLHFRSKGKVTEYIINNFRAFAFLFSRAKQGGLFFFRKL